MINDGSVHRPIYWIGDRTRHTSSVGCSPIGMRDSDWSGHSRDFRCFVCRKKQTAICGGKNWENFSIKVNGPIRPTFFSAKAVLESRNVCYLEMCIITPRNQSRDEQTKQTSHVREKRETNHTIDSDCFDVVSSWCTWCGGRNQLLQLHTESIVEDVRHGLIWRISGKTWRKKKKEENVLVKVDFRWEEWRETDGHTTPTKPIRQDVRRQTPATAAAAAVPLTSWLDLWLVSTCTKSATHSDFSSIIRIHWMLQISMLDWRF